MTPEEIIIMTKWPQEFWLTKPIVVMVMLIFVSNLVVGCGTASPEPPTPTPALFDYLVRVQAKDTSEPIPNAEVTIEVIGKAPLDDITDVKGVARIRINSSYAGEPGELIVIATGYVTHRQHINLTKDALPDKVRLEREFVGRLAPTPTSTVTPEPTPTSTPTPILTPTPVFIEAPRDLNLRVAPSLRSVIITEIPKDSLLRIACTYYDDENREWWEVETKNRQRGWTLWDEDTRVGTPPGEEKFTPPAIPTVPSGEVPATPTALPPPTLISPKTVDNVTFLGEVILEWHWDNRTLEKGWFYSVRVGQDAETGHPKEPLPCFHDKFSFTNEYQGDLGACVPGRYYWEVAVAARNEEFVQESTSTEYIPEEVEEWTEVSVVSAREYFYYTDQEPTPTNIPPTPTDTPEPMPTDTPAPPPTDTPGPSNDDTPEPPCLFPPCD
jgi:hypothetical protein